MAKKTERSAKNTGGSKRTPRKKPLPKIDPLFVPHLDEIRGLSELLLELPSGGDEYSAILESICGATDDSQPVEQYDGTLGVTIAFVNAHEAPVGQLQWNNNLASIYDNPGNVSGIRWCTGTMISNDLFLAAGHCFDQTGGGWIRPMINGTSTIIPSSEIATNMHVNFNYQVNSSGVLQTEQSFAVTQLVEYRLGGLDFAIVRLAGNPGATYGTTQVATTDAVAGDSICIIGYPAGQPKRIEAGAVLGFSGDYITYDDIDTLGGNSGSGILRASDGLIVGVHTNGGCTQTGGHNRGVRISSIWAQSPTLQGMAGPGPKLKVADDGMTLKFIDDGTSFKFTDDPKLKFFDDPKLKFTDDPKLKALDDTKAAGLDKMGGDRKMAGMDTHGFDPRRYMSKIDPAGLKTTRPFIMSTPHHSMAWAQAQAGAGLDAAQQHLAQYENAIVQLEQLLSMKKDELDELDANYRQLLAEYQAVKSQLQ